MNNKPLSVDGAWHIIEARMKDALVIAEEVYQEIGHATELPNKNLVEKIQSLSNGPLLNLYRLALIDSYSAQGTLRLHLNLLLETIQEEQSRRDATQHETAASESKLEEYNKLLLRYVETTRHYDERNFETALSMLDAILHDWMAVSRIEPDIYLRKDLFELRSNALVLKGTIYGLQGRKRDQETVFQEALEEAEQALDPHMTLSLRNKLSDCYYTGLQFDKALKILLPLRLMANTTTLEFVDVELRLATLYRKIGDHFETRKSIERAAGIMADKGFDPPTESGADFLISWVNAVESLTWPEDRFLSVFMNIATMQMRIQSLIAMTSTAEKDAEQARKCMQNVQSLVTKIQDLSLNSVNPRVASTPSGAMSLKSDQLSITEIVSQVNALTTRFQSGTFTDPDLETAEELRSKLSVHEHEGLYYTLLICQGDGLLMCDREKEALDIWKYGLEVAKREDHKEFVVEFLGRIAISSETRKDPRLVLGYIEEIIECIESYRYQVSTAYLQGAFLKDKVMYYSAGVKTAWQLGDYQKMLRIADYAKGWASTRSFKRTNTSESASEKRELIDELVELSRVISSGSDHSNQQDDLIKRRMLWDKLTLLNASNTQAAGTLNLAGLQQSLKMDQAILHYYWLAEQHLIVTCIRHDTVTVNRQTLNDQAYQALSAFPAQISRSHGVRSADSDTRGLVIGREDKASADLNVFMAHLLPEEIRHAITGVTRLWISPHQHLHSIPFHAFTIEGRFLIEQCAISYIPNLGVLSLDTHRSPSEGILIVGSANYNVRGISLSALPGVTKEIANIETLYRDAGRPVHVFNESGATVSNIRKHVQDGGVTHASVLHFALHGNDIPADVPMEDNIFLTDGALDGLEISTWNLHADLVVLSACNSGERAVAGRGMTSFPGDEVYGLQAAFFTAGARRVLGTLWPVNDLAAVKIMTEFHRHLLNSKEPAMAMQLSVQQFLSTATYKQRDPFYWAPFFVVERVVEMGQHEKV